MKTNNIKNKQIMSIFVLFLIIISLSIIVNAAIDLTCSSFDCSTQISRQIEENDLEIDQIFEDLKRDIWANLGLSSYTSIKTQCNKELRPLYEKMLAKDRECDEKGAYQCPIQYAPVKQAMEDCQTECASDLRGYELDMCESRCEDLYKIDFLKNIHQLACSTCAQEYHKVWYDFRTKLYTCMLDGFNKELLGDFNPVLEVANGKISIKRGTQELVIESGNQLPLEPGDELSSGSSETCARITVLGKEGVRSVISLKSDTGIIIQDDHVKINSGSCFVSVFRCDERFNTQDVNLISCLENKNEALVGFEVKIDDQGSVKTSLIKDGIQVIGTDKSILNKINEGEKFDSNTEEKTLLTKSEINQILEYWEECEVDADEEEEEIDESLFVWDYNSILNDQSGFIDFVKENSIDRVFIAISHTDFNNLQIEYNSLNSQLHQNGVKVFALYGNYDWNKPEVWSWVNSNYINPTLNYNKDNANDFDGVILDVEPWISACDGCWDDNQDLDNYLKFLKDTKFIVKSQDLDLYVVTPFWFDNNKNNLKDITKEVSEIADAVVIMDYTDDVNNLISFVSTELSHTPSNNILAIETKDLGESQNSVTFHEEGTEAMYTALDQLHNNYKDNSNYKGLAIHEYKSFKSLKEQEDTPPPPPPPEPAKCEIQSAIWLPNEILVNDPVTLKVVGDVSESCNNKQAQLDIAQANKKLSSVFTNLVIKEDWEEKKQIGTYTYEVSGDNLLKSFTSEKLVVKQLSCEADPVYGCASVDTQCDESGKLKIYNCQKTEKGSECVLDTGSYRCYSGCIGREGVINQNIVTRAQDCPDNTFYDKDTCSCKQIINYCDTNDECFKQDHCVSTDSKLFECIQVRLPGSGRECFETSSIKKCDQRCDTTVQLKESCNENNGEFNSLTCECELKSECGNNVCEDGETIDTCVQDCIIPPVCGDNVCETDETIESCSEDCTPVIPEPVCGNEIFEDGEECDIGGCEPGFSCSNFCVCVEQPLEPVCGDSICDIDETEELCSEDCQEIICESAECENPEITSYDEDGCPMYTCVIIPPDDETDDTTTPPESEVQVCTFGDKECITETITQTCIKDPVTEKLKWKYSGCKKGQVCLEGQCIGDKDEEDDYNLAEFVSSKGLSAQLKRSYPGVIGVQSSEAIFDVMNLDHNHKLMGYVRCKTSSDVILTAGEGIAAAGAGATSPMFEIGEAPDQRSIFLSFGSKTAGNKQVTCTFEYVPYKMMKDGTVRYLTNQGTYSKDDSDTLYRSFRLDNSLTFVEKPKQLPPAMLKQPIEQEPEKSFIEKLVPYAWIVIAVAVLIILAVYLLGKTSRWDR